MKYNIVKIWHISKNIYHVIEKIPVFYKLKTVIFLKKEEARYLPPPAFSIVYLTEMTKVTDVIEHVKKIKWL